VVAGDRPGRGRPASGTSVGAGRCRRRRRGRAEHRAAHERGEWVAAHNLFLVCSVLGLRIEQTVEVADPRPAAPADRAARRALARPAAHDRVATREEVLAGRAVLTALARHHELAEPRVDLNGTVYVRSGGSGFGLLWRFATVAAQTLGVWVNVSADEGEANRNEAQLL
jgi:hypothetical protein